ncbi:uracil-DNA glycosylase [Natronomonas sp. EA1]|uniref:uracil-DNA glycosylase n=1 Tax=Natronomonas sp. EA1 TaxID=3421655 RepID=UPI003EBA8007
MSAFPDPDERNPLAADCRRCPALAEARTCISWGVGPLDASLVVVGEAPAAGDPEADQWRGGNLTGMAYTNQVSGKKIRTLIADLGYAEDCYYTNSVKCFPPDGEGSNREPTPEESANCRPYLLREIEQVEPTAILPTGKHATQSLFDAAGRELDGFLDTVLTRYDLDLGAPVIPLLHPAYQELWMARLDHTRESYLAAIAESIRG